MHWYGLRHLLKKCQARIVNRIVFSHPIKEPWRTVGVFLKIAGKNPERSKSLGKFYPKYGHSVEQLEEAFRFGRIIGSALTDGKSIEEINFQTSTALPKFPTSKN